MDLKERIDGYANSDCCWQYSIRRKTLEEDILVLPKDINPQELKVSDFTFRPLTTDKEYLEAKEFIKRYEWLGKLAMNTTHYFGAYYKDILCGVVTMGCPNAFSTCMGKDTSKYERLISRGACISWSPKGLASSLIMWAIHWMVSNTDFRLFTAYSDPEAKELGTIYQACSFYYLGSGFGGTKKYKSPYSGKWISDRTFRVRSYYKRYAQDLGIVWQDDWSKGDKVYWDRMPENVVKEIKDYGKQLQKSSEYMVMTPKHKYAFVLGRGKIETKRLRKLFLQNTRIFDYPKERGR